MVPGKGGVLENMMSLPGDTLGISSKRYMGKFLDHYNRGHFLIPPLVLSVSRARIWGQGANATLEGAEQNQCPVASSAESFLSSVPLERKGKNCAATSMCSSTVLLALVGSIGQEGLPCFLLPRASQTLGRACLYQI